MLSVATIINGIMQCHLSHQHIQDVSILKITQNQLFYPTYSMITYLVDIIEVKDISISSIIGLLFLPDRST